MHRIIASDHYSIASLIPRLAAHGKGHGMFRIRTRPAATLLIVLISAAICGCEPGPQSGEVIRAVTPDARTDGTPNWWTRRHEQKLRDIKAQEKVDLLMIGDSITHAWEDTGKAAWERYYAKRHAFNLGFGGDRTENVLWRLQNGAVDGVSPRLVVLMIGTNNAYRKDKPRHIAAGVEAIIGELRRRLPDAKVLVLAIFPRGPGPDDELRRINDAANGNIAGFADREHVFFLDINDAFLDEDGTLPESIMPDLLHPNEKGYELWAAAMEPMVKKLMGEE